MSNIGVAQTAITGKAAGGGGGSGTVTNTIGALTANAVVVGNGGNNETVVGSLGTSGQVLTSNGAGLAPTWQTPAAADLSNGVQGSGAVVLATSPTLTTPVLGVATATTINKVTLTAPATGSTLTIADGKTLTANNSLTLAGTDDTTMTFQSTSGTVVATVGTAYDGTGLTANVASTNLVASGSMTSNMLIEVSAHWIVTTGGTTSTLPTLNIQWTDVDNSAAQSTTVGPASSFEAGAAGSATGNSTTTRGQAVVVANCKSGTALTFTTSAYASTGNTMQYALHIRTRRIG